MRRGQRTFRPDKKEDRIHSSHKWYLYVAISGIHVSVNQLRTLSLGSLSTRCQYGPIGGMLV